MLWRFITYEWKTGLFRIENYIKLLKCFLEFANKLGMSYSKQYLCFL